MTPVDQLLHSAGVVRVGDDQRGGDRGSVGQAHASGPTALHQDLLDGAQCPDLAPARLDHLGEACREHLSAPRGVGRAAHVVVDDRGVHHHRGLRRAAGVQPRPVVEHRLGPSRQLGVLEQLRQRTERPAVERRCVDAGDRPDPALLGDLAEDVHAALHAGTLLGEGRGDAVAVLVPVRRHGQLEVGEHQGVEAVGVERPELDAIADAERAEDRREQPAGSAVADVVQSDVELVVLAEMAAAEHLAVAAGQVVALEHQHPTTGSGQARPGGQTAGAGADHHDVPGLDHRFLRDSRSVIRRR